MRLLALLLLLASLPALAKSAPPAAPQREVGPAVPVVSDAPQWAGALLAGVAVLFVAALLIGPIYRLNLPDDLPPTHSHDEPPGSSHRHGPSGTIDYSAPDRHAK